MATSLPSLAIDNILVQYNVGDVLLLVFGLSVLAALVVRSRKVLGLNTLLFGVILVLTPIGSLGINASSLLSEPIAYKFLGMALVLAGPVLFATADK
jgi:hypothetical protein